MSDLEKRMALYVPGQVTWPEPGDRRKCNGCDHFTGHNLSNRRQAKGYGRCAKTSEMLGRDGPPFVGATAQAGRLFRSKT